MSLFSFVFHFFCYVVSIREFRIDDACVVLTTHGNCHLCSKRQWFAQKHLVHCLFYLCAIFYIRIVPLFDLSVAFIFCIQIFPVSDLCFILLLFFYLASKYFLCQTFFFDLYIIVLYPEFSFVRPLFALCLLWFCIRNDHSLDLCFILILCFCNQIVPLSDLYFILMLYICNQIVILTDLCFILMLCFCT